MKKIKNPKEAFVLTIFIGMFVVGLYFFINSFNYLDPFNLCYIKIEGDIVRGNEDSITAALRLIKNENKNAYRETCKYVDRISERYCFATDWHLDESQYQKEAQGPGCYVKGSKTVYLKPDRSTGDTVENMRKDSIIKYAGFSRDYWNK